MTPRTPSTGSALVQPETPLNLEDQIRRRAYEIYEQRGGEHGHDVEDWLRAEKQITETQTRSAPVITADRSVTPAQRPPTRVCVEIKEAHAYAGTKVTDVRAASDAKPGFDVFISVSLVSEMPSPLSVRDCHLKIGMPEGKARLGEWIKGDLGNWRIQTEREEGDLWDTWITTLKAGIAELNTVEPLQYGVRRVGWLHFRVRDITASQLQNGSMYVAVEDSLSGVHVGSVSLLGSLSYPVSAGRVVPLDVPPPQPRP